MQKHKELRAKDAYLYIALLAVAALLVVLLSTAFGSRGRDSLEERLAGILGSMEGAGKVRVLINVSEQQILPAWSATEFSGNTSQTVGVVIAAQGADDPVVAARLVQAAGTVLGIDQTQIEIICMEK